VQKQVAALKSRCDLNVVADGATSPDFTTKNDLRFMVLLTSRLFRLKNFFFSLDMGRYERRWDGLCSCVRVGVL